MNYTEIFNRLVETLESIDRRLEAIDSTLNDLARGL